MELGSPIMGVLLIEYKYLKRKKSILLCLGLTVINNMGMGLEWGSFTLLAGIGKFLGNLLFTLMYTFTIELFPTH
jgi:hypothetical protein